jgi:hypothetical protein
MGSKVRSHDAAEEVWRMHRTTAAAAAESDLTRVDRSVVTLVMHRIGRRRELHGRLRGRHAGQRAA